jgi:ABC-2 type transport system permease protein
MIVGIPLMQLVLFGYAINFTLRDLDTAGFRPGPPPRGSRALVMDMQNTGDHQPGTRREQPTGAHDDAAAGRDQRRRGGAAGLSNAAASTGAKPCQVLVDGSDTAVQAAAVQLAQTPLDSAAYVKPRPSQISVVGFYNPERRSAINIVPGLIGIILTMTDGDVHRGRHRARTRTRQHGVADRDSPSAAAN